MTKSTSPLSKEVQDIVNAAVLQYPAKWTGGVCAFQTFDRDTGASLGGRISAGECHSTISYGRAGVGEDNFVVVNAHKKNWVKTNSDFLFWVARESPFFHGILNRDNTEEIEGHASVLDAGTIGRGGVLWTCKAFRHFQEDAYKLPIWTQLRDLGLNGLQAFIGADILQPDGSPHPGNSHVSLFAYSKPKDLRKFYDELTSIKKLEGGTANRGSYGAYGYDDKGEAKGAWGSMKGKPERKSDGWGGFIEVVKPCEPKEYAGLLKEIFEGDPRNVK